MFQYCNNFNQPITINGSTNIASMLSQCHNFNSDIRIKSLGNACSLLLNCSNFAANVYIDALSNTANLYTVIGFSNNSLSKAIHIPSDLTDFVLNQYLCYNGSAIQPAFEALGDGNGYYNATYNVYIYNNYIPA